MTDKYTPREIVEGHRSVKCAECGALHDLEGDTFISVHGNICVGIGGGVVGNNLEHDGRVKSITVYCREPQCIKKLYNRLAM